MKRLLVPILVFVGVLLSLASLLAWYVDEGGDTRLLLAEVSGTVTVTGPDFVAEDAERGRELVAEDRVSTGRDGRAVLELGRGTRIRLAAESTVQVRAVDTEGVQLELEDGALHARVRPDSGSLRVSSDGREALLTDAEVSIGIAPDGTLQMEAERGEVMIAGIAGAPSLAEGSRLVAPVRGHAEIGEIPEEMLLAVEWPERKRTRSETVVVSGRTEPSAVVLLAGATGVVEVRADPEGRFTALMPLVEGENAVKVEAIDLFGNQVSVDGVLERDLSGPAFHGGVEYEP